MILQQTYSRGSCWASIVSFSSNKDWSIVNTFQLSLDALPSVLQFTCGGVAEFKLTHHSAYRLRVVSNAYPSVSKYKLSVSPVPAGGRLL